MKTEIVSGLRREARRHTAVNLAKRVDQSTPPARPKAVSPLRSATALQKFAALLLCVLALMPFGSRAATTNDLAALLRNGLFEEQVNHDMNAAIATYQSLVTQFDKDRLLTATAVFRLGECYRTIGKTNEAAAQYQRVIREFPDQATLVTLSKQNLTSSGYSSFGEKVSGKEPSTVSAEAKALASQLSGIEKMKSDPEEQARAVIAFFPDDVLKNMLPQMTKLQKQVERVTANPRLSYNEIVERDGDYSAVSFDGQSIRGTLISSATNLDLLANFQRESGLQLTWMKERVSFILGIQEARLKALLAANSPEPATSVSTEIKSGSDEEDQEIRRIQTMIQNSPDLINAVSGDDRTTPLVRAAKSGQLRVAQYLLDHNADVNLQTPLLQAAVAGHKAMVELLLRHGANEDSRNRALRLAAQNGFKAVAEVLIGNKTDVNAPNPNGDTALLHAAGEGRTALIEFLIAKGANVNVTNNSGVTPLSLAAKKDLASVKALLAAKADPNGGTVNLPLHSAIKANSANIVEELLKVGADANRSARAGIPQSPGGGSPENMMDATPLAVAVISPQLDIIKLLLTNKADPNGKRSDGVPLIFSAVGNADMMKAFLDAGAKPNVDDGSGNHRTPLSSTGVPSVITLLLAAGADPEVNLPLLAQVDYGQLESAEALLKGGANVNAVNRNGETALHFATARNNAAMIALLLSYKADVNARNNQGLTPLDYAERRNQTLGQPTVRIPSPTPVPFLLNAGSAQTKTETVSIADLLRQHGGLADLPKLDRIEVTRPDTGYRSAAFYSGTNGWNQFTLLEVLAQQWGLLSTKQSGGWTRLGAPEYWSLNNGNPIRFPNLARVKIHRPGKDNETKTTLTEDLTILDAKTGGMRDIPLQMGDVVEVPESDHPVNETWRGFVQPDYLALSNSIARTVTLRVGGTPTNLTLTPVIFAEGSTIRLIAPSFMIRSVLDESKLIRSSSDLTRVKVTRRESANAKPLVWILDCSNPDKSPDLWLRNGDVIEVPEK